MSFKGIIEKDSGRFLEIVNPATLEKVGEYQIAGPPEIAAAIEKARAAQKKWSKTDFAARSSLFKKVQDWLTDNLDRGAQVVNRETGKPRKEALAADLIPAMDALEYSINEGPAALADEPIPLRLRYMKISSRLIYEPLGVIGIVSPWNYPIGIPFSEIAMAIYAGNAVVIKPSEHTPGSALFVREAFIEGGGLDPDLIAVLPGDGQTGAQLVEAEIDKLIFTGSVATGKKVQAASASSLRQTVLELGGSDPMIVLADADLELAADAAIWGRFTNAGQTCAAVKRLFVHTRIYDDFVEMVTARAGALVVGPDRNFDVDMGPVISATAIENLERQLADAVEQGAKVSCGGGRLKMEKGFFFAPTILTGVTPQMAVMREETFGPLLPIVPFNTARDAVRLANDTNFGLSASIWTRDIARANNLAQKIDAGTITINNVLYTYGLMETPWGGFKESGTGKTHSRIGFHEMTKIKHVNIDNLFTFTNPWWYPYSTGKNAYDELRSVLQVLYGRKNYGAGFKGLLGSFLEISGKWKRRRKTGTACRID